MNLKYFNRKKQFIIRLVRNNLFLGNKSPNKIQNTVVKYYACGGHPESRTELMLNCPRTNKLLQFLIRTLKKEADCRMGVRLICFCSKIIQLNQLKTFY